MNEEALAQRPWLKGALELLEHAVFHFRAGTAKDLRFAMIHADNAVELAGRLYLKREKRLQDKLSADKVKEFERNFPKLLQHLNSELAFDTLTHSNIEYFHEIRNTLYHDGDGISVEPHVVSSYLTTAARLLDQMYGVKLSLAGEVPKTELRSPMITIKPGELPQDVEGAHRGRFLFVESQRLFTDAVALRYRVMGYEAAQDFGLRTTGRVIIADLIYYKGKETIIAEVKVWSPNRDGRVQLASQSKSIGEELAAMNVPVPRFRLHILSPSRPDATGLAELGRAGWEVEEWKTTRDILNDHGHADEAEAVELGLRQYEQFTSPTADDVRHFALKSFIQPARERGEKTVSFTATDVHKGMGLQARFPLVCSSIDGGKFMDLAKVVLVKRDGPKQSSTVRWVFDLGA